MIFMDLCNESCSSGQPSSVAKTFALDVTCKLFSLFFFHGCHTHRYHDLTIYTTFTDLDLAWTSQDQRKEKPTGLVFSHTFQLIRVKFDVVMKLIKLNILRLLLSKIY